MIQRIRQDFGAVCDDGTPGDALQLQLEEAVPSGEITALIHTTGTPSNARTVASERLAEDGSIAGRKKDSVNPLPSLTTSLHSILSRCWSITLW